MGDWRQTAIIVTAIVVAAFLIGGRYTVVMGKTGPYMFLVDRFTGSVQWCTAVSGCKYVSAQTTATVAPLTPTPNPFDQFDPKPSATP